MESVTFNQTTRVCGLLILSLLPTAGCSPEPVSERKAGSPTVLSVDNRQIDFGTTVPGKAVTHRYAVKNTGDKVVNVKGFQLLPSRYAYTAECEFSTRAIPAGGQIDVTLTIVPREPAPETYYAVTLETEPANPIRIGGKLKVESPLELKPPVGESDLWYFEIGDDGEPKPFQGLIHSVVAEGLRFAPVRSSHPHIKATLTPLEGDALTTLKTASGEPIRAKSAARIRVTAEGLTTVGPFAGNLTFATTAPPGYEIKQRIVGVRRGPLLRVFATGAEWNSKTCRLDLGRFPAAAGKTVQLRLVLAAPAGEDFAMRWEQVTSDSPNLAVRIEPDTRQSTPTRKWATLRLTVPPGKPATIQSRTNPIHVRILTNHPQAKELHFRLMMISS